jgi:hypothetical protein
MQPWSVAWHALWRLVERLQLSGQLPLITRSRDA